jgi:hypothetical protein
MHDSIAQYRVVDSGVLLLERPRVRSALFSFQISTSDAQAARVVLSVLSDMMPRFAHFGRERSSATSPW